MQNMIIDYAGRRPLLLGGYILMAGWATVFMVALSQQVINFIGLFKGNAIGLCFFMWLGCQVVATNSKCSHWLFVVPCGCRLRLAGCLISAWPAFSPISWALELDQVSSPHVSLKLLGAMGVWSCVQARGFGSNFLSQSLQCHRI